MIHTRLHRLKQRGSLSPKFAGQNQRRFFASSQDAGVRLFSSAEQKFLGLDAPSLPCHSMRLLLAAIFLLALTAASASAVGDAVLVARLPRAAHELTWEGWGTLFAALAPAQTPAASSPAFAPLSKPTDKTHFEIGSESSLLNGQPFAIRCGDIRVGQELEITVPSLN
jgi:hypothetical protein